MARVPPVQRSQPPAVRRAARAGHGSLELLLQFRRVGDGRQPDSGSRRRKLQDRRPLSRSYSLLDQYAMGLVRDVDVPPMFYVESPTNVSSSAEADSAPRVGVTFTAHGATC